MRIKKAVKMTQTKRAKRPPHIIGDPYPSKKSIYSLCLPSCYCAPQHKKILDVTLPIFQL